ncbi:PH domain-containing protein [Pedobacter nyackensis]|uniref:PH domain-containing protein n=1 Tax=Pedobacter nyackensis TaxID=475255 RepID=UPI00292E2FE1|nr:PH domain-containing protein [Pedobacter nyackensis]
MTIVYKSKVGNELVIPLTLVFVVTLFMAIFNEPHWPGLAILLPVILFIVHMFSTTYYTVDGDVLKVKCGFLYNAEIDIKTIKKISETNNPISSPALSLDRLDITYNKYDNVIISPKDKAEFISALTALNPNIEVKLKSVK